MKKLLVILVVLAMTSSVWAAPFAADYSTDTSADYTIFNWWNEASTGITQSVNTTLDSYTFVFDRAINPANGEQIPTSVWQQSTHKTARLEVGETAYAQFDVGTLSGKEWYRAGLTVATAESWFAWMPNGINVFRNNAIDSCQMVAENFAGSVPAGEFYHAATRLGNNMDNWWIAVQKTAADTLAVSYSDDGTNYIAMGNSVNAAYIGADLYLGLRVHCDDLYERWNWYPNPGTVEIQTLEIIPEPATLGLLAIGSLLAIRRRRA